MTQVDNNNLKKYRKTFLFSSGKKVRGRKYPWGTVNIEDKDHCDFLSLRSLVLAHHMQVHFYNLSSILNMDNNLILGLEGCYESSTL